MASDDFLALLAEAGIAFVAPTGYLPCAVRDNSVFRYQYALRSPSGDLELRYRIDSFARLDAARMTAAAADMDTNARVTTGQMYATNLMAILFNLSGDLLAEPRVQRPEGSAALFHADWSALNFIRLTDHEFAPEFDSAFVVAMHKENVADIYVIGLHNNSGATDWPFDKNTLAPDIHFT